jgi:hypothetical protein
MLGVILLMNFQKLKYYTPPKTRRLTEVIKSDLCIYGGTSAGVVAAIQAKKMGLNVVIIEQSTHMGGMSSSGLGATDIGNKAAIGGISRCFYDEILRYYGNPNKKDWTFEPHVAEGIFNKWVEENEIPVYFNEFLDKVHKNNTQIVQISMESGLSFSAAMFIDATYEGDLMAGAGISYHVGRESNSTYKETLNGIHFCQLYHNFKAWVDPHVIERKPDSGLLKGVACEETGFQGQGDSKIQAYNFRICLTDVQENKIPFSAPPNYDPERYTLLLRYINAGIWDSLNLNIRIPNGKTDLNNYGAVSTDNIGCNYNWPEGSYEIREKIFQDHFIYNLGILYFLGNDKRVPENIRSEVSKWGLPKDEFMETGGFPHSLYVREGRRMISDIVITENECRGYHIFDDSIGLAAYQMDSHNCRRIVIDGRCINEGDVQIEPTAPYPISYRATTPNADQCSNLLVPVCLSASHIAFGSIRMEPVFMILGQSAATAAAIALEDGVIVQDINYQKLCERLLADKQVLRWKV